VGHLTQWSEKLFLDPTGQAQSKTAPTFCLSSGSTIQDR
jgi:hypothetical protein